MRARIAFGHPLKASSRRASICTSLRQSAWRTSHYARTAARECAVSRPAAPPPVGGCRSADRGQRSGSRTFAATETADEEDGRRELGVEGLVSPALGVGDRGWSLRAVKVPFRLPPPGILGPRG